MSTTICMLFPHFPPGNSLLALARAALHILLDCTDFMSLIIVERRWLHRLCLPRFPPIRFTSGPTVPFEEDVPRNVFFKFSFPAYLNRNARDCVLIFDKNPLKVGHRNISSVRRENGFSSTCEPFIRSDNCYSMLTILQSRPSFAAGETSLRRVHRRGSYKRLSG